MLTLLLFFCLNPEPAKVTTINLSELGIQQSRALAAASSGEIGVIDRAEQQLVLLRPNGEVIKRIGNGGQGPGELQIPGEICWSKADGAFAVIDFANTRLSKWSPSGQFMGETRLPTGFLAPRMATTDRVFLTKNAFGSQGNQPTLVKLNLANGTIDEIYHHQVRKARQFSTIGSDANAVTVMFRWDPALVYGLGSSFLAVAFGSEAQILKLDFAGKPQGRPIQVRLPRYEVTTEQIQEGIGHLPKPLQRGAGPGIKKPDAWPTIRAVHVDPKDRIWVFGANRDVGQPYPYQVFDKAGKLLKKGMLAELPLWINAKHAYYLQTRDEDLHLGMVAIQDTL